MNPTRLLGCLPGFALAVVPGWLAGMALAADDRQAQPVSRYELTTPGDLLMARLVSPSMKGDVADWSRSLLGTLPGQVGDWVSRFLDAHALAGIISEAFAIEGQPAAGPLQEVVADCARVLGVERPSLHLRHLP